MVDKKKTSKSLLFAQPLGELVNVGVTADEKNFVVLFKGGCRTRDHDFVIPADGDDVDTVLAADFQFQQVFSDDFFGGSRGDETVFLV